MKAIHAWFIQLSPRARQVLVILLAAVALFTVLAIFQSDPKKREIYDKKRDQVLNVLTDTSNRNVGLDNMAGQIRRLNEENEKLLKEVKHLRDEQASAMARDKTQELTAKLKTLEGQLDALAQKQTHLDTSVSEVVEAQRIGKFAKTGSSKKSEEGASAEGHSMDGQASVQGKDANAVTTVHANPFAEQPMTKTTSPQSQKNARPAQIRINVVGDEEEVSASKPPKETKPEDAVAYIPAGSILTGTIITGADFPTSKGGFENPTPTLIRLQKEAILPNRYRSDVRECFLLVGGRGDLASERAKLRGEMLSCVRNDGAVIETKLNAYVTGEDGKEGVKGRLVSKQGQMIARSLVAGFASGMSEAFDYDPVPVIATDASNSTQYQQNFSGDAVKGGFAKGASTALERVADFYMDLAEEMFPVIEINAGRQVDVVVIAGTRLHVSTESVSGRH